MNKKLLKTFKRENRIKSKGHASKVQAKKALLSGLGQKYGLLPPKALIYMAAIERRGK